MSEEKKDILEFVDHEITLDREQKLILVGFIHGMQTKLIYSSIGSVQSLA